MPVHTPRQPVTGPIGVTPIRSEPHAGIARAGMPMPVGDLLSSLKATGASMGEAIGMASAILGEAAVQPFFDREVQKAPSFSGMVDFLDEVARSAPSLAGAWAGSPAFHRCLDAWDRSREAFQCILDGRSWLTSLPDDLHLYGPLAVDGCVNLTRLPRGLRVDGTFFGNGCAFLESIPDDFQVGGALKLSGCLSLRGLPRMRSPLLDLNLADCSALEELPDGLCVRGNLDLRNCISLKVLPPGVFVGGHIDLRGCLSWDGHFPADLVTGGLIRSDGYPAGASLASWRKWHEAGSPYG